MGFLIQFPPMGRSADDQTPRLGADPSHLAAPALTNITNALLLGSTPVDERINMTVVVTTGLEQHAYATQKGQILSVTVVSTGNKESGPIQYNGGNLMLGMGPMVSL